MDVSSENYFLAFFLVGAYQEVLGMAHNLFPHPTEATVVFEEDDYKIINLVPSESLLDILENMHYNVADVEKRLKTHVEKSTLIKKEDQQAVLEELDIYLNENGYLKTTQLI